MTDLERRLRALASGAFPPVPDVRDAVSASLAAAESAASGPPVHASGEPAAAARAADPRDEAGAVAAAARGRRRGLAVAHHPRRGLAVMRGRASVVGRSRGLALAVALVLVPAAAVAAVPGARRAVLDWLGLAHVRVERVPRVPRFPALDRGDLGRRVTSPAGAGRVARIRVVVPSTLGTPDAVYVSDGGVVSLVYEPRPGLRAERATDPGLLVTELRARGLPDYVAKLAGPHTLVEAVRVDGARGVFLSGAEHALLVEQPGRMVRPLEPRLAGNALAFERDGLVIRLEGGFDRGAALALARSLRPAGG